MTNQTKQEDKGVKQTTESHTGLSAGKPSPDSVGLSAGTPSEKSIGMGTGDTK
ncbi:MAG: hypothetical protein Q7R81_01785 [Candidatus Peregrinibacteria bacterium]|nr:hypothetical protein [Candidatus Peregrinibacteria bacterium]